MSSSPKCIPPALAAQPWNELSAFRETALRHFTRPEDRGSLVRLGELLTESALEQAHLWPAIPGSETGSAAAAAHRDLLHTLHFLLRLGDARFQSTLPQPEGVLAAIAARTARRLLPEVERFRLALERYEAAVASVN